MGLSLRLATVAATAAALIAPAAFAQVADPIPLPSNQTGSFGSGLFVSIWDTTKNVSLVEYLGQNGTGMNFQDALPSNLAPTNGNAVSLDFGVLPGYSSTFAGSDSANLVYTVWAGKSFGAAATQSFETTGPLGGFANTLINGNVTTVNTAGNTFIGQVNTACPSSVGCQSDATQNPALNTAAFAGQKSWGADYNGGLSGNLAAGAVGSPLGFYEVTKTSSSALSSANVVQYANSNGAGGSNFGQWLLNADGHLTYSIAQGSSSVPLPAAGWLLLSGLAGFGSIRRRRNSAP